MGIAIPMPFGLISIYLFAIIQFPIHIGFILNADIMHTAITEIYPTASPARKDKATCIPEIASEAQIGNTNILIQKITGTVSYVIPKTLFKRKISKTYRNL